MARIDVVDKNNKKVKSLDLPDNVFAGEVHNTLLYNVVNWQRAKKRSGTASTKTRGDVKHSTKKPFRQKGTGRARQGMTSSPLLIGGGTVFGPSPKDHSFKMNRKMKRKALLSALTYKKNQGQLLVVSDFDMPEIKTKNAKAVLDKLNVKSALIIDGVNENLSRSVSNLRDVKYLNVAGLNVYDLLRYEHVIVTEKSLEKINSFAESTKATK